MSSNTIYAPIEPIFSAISRNPGLAGSLVSAFESHRNGNPSVINKHFRVLLEAAGVNYHKQGYSPKEIYYRIIHNDWGDHNCEICGKPINVFRKLEDGFTRFCSAKHAAIAESTKKARKNTVQELYGVDNVWHTPEVQAKARETSLEKFGVEHYQTTQEFSQRFKETYSQKSDEEKASIQEKRESTLLATHGVRNPMQSEEILARVKETQIAKYGDHPKRTEAVQEQYKQTCLAKYGVEHPSQNPEIFLKQVKSRHSVKLYTFPSGNTVNIQGFEWKALDKLLDEGYCENDIQLTDRPTVKYFWSSLDGFGDDKWHIYHPDIVIPKENRIIEVKSTWTYNGRPHYYYQNKAKEKACINAGFRFEFWVF